VNEGEALALRDLAGESRGVLERAAMEQDARAVALRVTHLHVGRVLRHDDGRRDAESPGVVGDALGVIARRHGDHPGAPLRGAEAGELVVGAALLEGGRELQVLELQPHRRAGDLGERERGPAGRALHLPGDAAGCFLDLRDGDGSGGHGANTACY